MCLGDKQRKEEKRDTNYVNCKKDDAGAPLITIEDFWSINIGLY